ncbi:SemiSWEET transporter [Culicoidibacter larvae]|uniref:Glutathione synthetase n=1 Tax=Culicoidibacter larvae TaxID=2579976 RepID=A0A5R8QIK0_9FIRM|nr:SemiSWEET transporter [Culicoidibacter larvae]TLG77273.1 hypothetical protein FEZ08_01260 [Culicoidibacter larvae]
MQFLGYIAAVCTTISFLPQAIKTVKEKDTSSISLGMYSFFTFGVFCWAIYGIYIGDISIILANVITFIFAAIILAMKLKYK